MILFLQSLLRFPKMVLATLLMISIAFLFIIGENTRMETNLDHYMPQDHPAFVYSNQAEEWFNIQDGIIIAIEHKNGIYNSDTLQKVKDLTKSLQKMDEIENENVISLYTVDNIIGTESGLDVKPFFDTVPKSQEDLEALRRSVRDNEMVFDRLVNRDETVTIVIAEIKDDSFSQEFYKRLLDLAKEYEGPEALYVAGRPIVEGTLAYLGPRDMQRMVPVVIAVILIVLFAVLRSLKATLLTFLVVLFSVVWAFGLMATVNIPLYSVSTMIPVMLIAIGVAYGIHLYSHLYFSLRQNPQADKQAATLDMLEQMWKPVAMAAITTAVGFISLLTSEVYPVKYFGLFTAFGVLAALLFSLLLIPAGTLVFGLPRWEHTTMPGKGKKLNEEHGNRLLTSIASSVIQHKHLTYLVTVGIMVLSIWGATKVWINSSFLDNFEKESDIVRTDTFINKYFGGTSTLNVILDAEQEDAFKDPRVLEAIDHLQKDVEGSLDVVGNSFGLTDYLKRMNKVMHEDNEAYNVIPETKDLVAQYLLLYEMSGDPENLWKVVDYNYQKANITFQLKSDTSIALKSAIAKIGEHLPELNALGINVNYAGSGYKALVFTDLILEGQIKSLVISLLIVVLLLAFMFKKVSAGLIGAVPIAITALISFGAMGLLDIPLSTTTALLSSIAIGIGVDYAVHFIERYKMYASETGDKVRTGRETMVHAGRAIAFNALVVIAGFLVLLVSVFPPNRTLGALISMNMFTSFLGTVSIMYLLLVEVNMYFKKNK